MVMMIPEVIDFIYINISKNNVKRKKQTNINNITFFDFSTKVKILSICIRIILLIISN